MHVLAALDLGQRPRDVVIRDADLARSFRQAAATWIGAAPAPARERRQQVAAAALLFLAFRALDAGDGPAVKGLIEEECARMRRGRPAEFERRWLLASLALVEWSGDRGFLTGPCDSARRLPCDHLSHVRTWLPAESLVQLTELTVPGPIAARQRGVLAPRFEGSGVHVQCEFRGTATGAPFAGAIRRTPVNGPPASPPRG